MKIAMNNCQEKEVNSKSWSNSSKSNNKIRIAVFGQHDVGKSALTVRYLTRRFIGEYKSNTDLLYRQTLSVNHGTLDIEIVDISTVEGPTNRKTFPVEEIQRADAFVIVYSITDKSSFTFALEALSDISKNSNNSSETPKQVALIGNKSDLEHLRSVDQSEGLSASLKYGTAFYELSVAENSPEVYQSFQTIITNLMGKHHEAKRKFSVSKMLGNLRLGRSSPSNELQPKGQASIVDTNVDTNVDTSVNNSPVMVKFKENSDGGFSFRRRGQRSRSSSSDSSSSSNFSNSICNLKSKIVELHSIKKWQNSSPICSL